ncbi:hypothetical protein MKX01_004332 [Papaver californicum]|nr:hypothetical protein MKX01_004332 [Papaver californicum]
MGDAVGDVNTVRKSSPTFNFKDHVDGVVSQVDELAQHKWAWPFMQPVDVKGLELDDYYEVIDKPMDFSTIRNNMELKDGTGYKNVREICADVRLVFKNAMTYNEEKSDVHVMAKTLLAKFEVEVGTKRKEEAEAHRDMQLAQEAANAKLARDISNELYEVDMHLDELREVVVQKCRKMSAEEKKKLGTGLGQLSPEDLNKALDIIAQKNPNLEATADEVDIDMDAQSESTLWRLKILVKEGLEVKAKSPATKAANDNSKRKREICDALAKSSKKRSKKPSSNIDPLS